MNSGFVITLPLWQPYLKGELRHANVPGQEEILENFKVKKLIHIHWVHCHLIIAVIKVQTEYLPEDLSK